MRRGQQKNYIKIMNRPTDQEISDKRDEASDATYKASKYPGMTYAEGIRDALEWVLGEAEDTLNV